MDLSDAYANAAYIPDGNGFPARWRAASLRFLATEQAGVTILPYGPTPRQQIHLIRPGGPVLGLVVFVHGGYWRAFEPLDFLHLAQGALARGWVVAMPGYDLCPGVRVSQITRQIAAATRVAARAVPGPIVLTGHSAGGHLAARMLDPGVGLPAELTGRLRRVVPISPLSDLRPLLQTDINADLRMDADEAEAESPILQQRPGSAVHVWVGGDERPAFLDQARWLSDAWGCPLTVEPDRHHFDVIEGLQRDSPLLSACLG